MKKLLLLLLTFFLSPSTFHLRLSTCSAQTDIWHAVVATDGSGDYTSVQAAVDAVPEGNLCQHLIYIKAGIYKEHVFIPIGKSRMSLIGEGADRVIISDDKKSGGPDALPVDKGATVVIHANDIVLQGISFVNSYGQFCI